MDKPNIGGKKQIDISDADIADAEVEEINAMPRPDVNTGPLPGREQKKPRWALFVALGIVLLGLVVLVVATGGKEEKPEAPKPGPGKKQAKPNKPKQNPGVVILPNNVSPQSRAVNRLVNRAVLIVESAPAASTSNTKTLGIYLNKNITSASLPLKNLSLYYNPKAKRGYIEYRSGNIRRTKFFSTGA